MEGVYRCLDCLGEPETCSACCKGDHARLPFHRVKFWNGRFFERSDLNTLGIIIHLGHRGAACPSSIPSSPHSESTGGGGGDWEDIADTEEDGDASILEKASTQPSEQWVGDTDRLTCFTANGVFMRRVRWCRCANAAERDVQLLRMRFFSASIKRPSTVFTFDVLDDYHIDAMECKTAASNYTNKIRRKTNPAFPSHVPVRMGYSFIGDDFLLYSRSDHASFPGYRDNGGSYP